VYKQHSFLLLDTVNTVINQLLLGLRMMSAYDIYKWSQISKKPHRLLEA